LEKDKEGLESVKVKMKWDILIRDAKNPDKILQHIHKENVITNGALALFATAMVNTLMQNYSGNNWARKCWYLVLGTGSGTPSAEDTNLFLPIAASAKSGTLSKVGSQFKYYVRYMPEDANGETYTEAGIFDDVARESNGSCKAYTEGTLINHLMLDPTLPKTSSILVDFYITVSFS